MNSFVSTKCRPFLFSSTVVQRCVASKWLMPQLRYSTRLIVHPMRDKKHTLVSSMSLQCPHHHTLSVAGAESVCSNVGRVGAHHERNIKTTSDRLSGIDWAGDARINATYAVHASGSYCSISVQIRSALSGRCVSLTKRSLVLEQLLYFWAPGAEMFGVKNARTTYFLERKYRWMPSDSGACAESQERCEEKDKELP